MSNIVTTVADSENTLLVGTLQSRENLYEAVLIKVQARVLQPRVGNRLRAPESFVEFKHTTINRF